MLFECPFNRFEVVVIIIGFITMDYTNNVFVNLVFLAWLFTTSITTPMLQNLWHKRYNDGGED